MAMASPSSRTQTSPRSYSSAFASSSAANFALRTSPFMKRAENIKLHGHRSLPPSPSSSVRFSVEQRPASPGRRSMTVTKKHMNNNVVTSSSTPSDQKRTCMCSPTTHPGSFRCGYHKRMAEQQQQRRQQTASSSGSKLNLRRSAMKNSLVRIGGVEGELVRRTLTTLIRPSSHHLCRRETFQPRPSRLSLMSNAQDS
ncbi:uncharacterized protein LOC133293470 [Gastrolobium bilobum]|uniref:uncharacterized protein LOC133293470 n=1 Tax=Gastrolobium bilobum TaxID=150636 RepID=UPI002AB2E9B7|nr:uncharacterized protein LOC133293470 [Gastrolobium bilobum]